MFGDKKEEKMSKELMGPLANDPMHDRILRQIGGAQL
jgi:hypothetical protein